MLSSLDDYLLYFGVLLASLASKCASSQVMVLSSSSYWRLIAGYLIMDRSVCTVSSQQDYKSKCGV